jgi:uncharacterized membrane protein YqgA involved in biofilm formation
MTGTFLNSTSVLAGSAIGLAIGSRLPERMRSTVFTGLGLVVGLVGLQMALTTKNVLVVLGAILAGGLLGEILRIQDGLEKIGSSLQALLPGSGNSPLGEGFVTASLVFCVGPMAILGAIQDGLTGDYRLLAIKSMLDGFASVAFSATLGWGVALSAVTILFYQGGITLFAHSLSVFLTDPMIGEMTATGGIIIIGIGVKLLDIKDIRLASLFPALVAAPLLVALIPVVKALFE